MKLTDEQMRELDAWIAENIFDFAWLPLNPGQGSARWLAPKSEWSKYKTEFVEHGIYQEDGIYDKRVPRYSTNPADALAVLKKCAEKCDQISIVECAGHWCICEGNGEHTSGDIKCEVESETLETAIALFAKELFSR